MKIEKDKWYLSVSYGHDGNKCYHVLVEFGAFEETEEAFEFARKKHLREMAVKGNLALGPTNLYVVTEDLPDCPYKDGFMAGFHLERSMDAPWDGPDDELREWLRGYGIGVLMAKKAMDDEFIESVWGREGAAPKKTRIPKWENLVVWTDDVGGCYDPLRGTQTTLLEMGQQGWEIVSAAPEPGDCYSWIVALKRPLVED